MESFRFTKAALNDIPDLLEGGVVWFVIDGKVMEFDPARLPWSPQWAL